MYGHTIRVEFTHTVLPPAHKMCCELSLRIVGVFGKLHFISLNFKEAGDGEVSIYGSNSNRKDNLTCQTQEQVAEGHG